MALHEPRLAHVRVRDVMHTGILTTDPSTPLRTVARLMAQQHVHAVAVADADHAGRPFGIVTALDIAAAAAQDLDRTAGEAVSTDIVTVSSGDAVNRAARVMAEHGLSHLVVVDAASGHPCGVLSTLDIAAVYAG
jgi:CBS domain-containing protein